MSVDNGDLDNPDFILSPAEKMERALIAKDRKIAENRADAHKALLALSTIWPLVSSHPLHGQREKDKVEEAFAGLSRIISETA